MDVDAILKLRVTYQNFIESNAFWCIYYFSTIKTIYNDQTLSHGRTNQIP